MKDKITKQELDEIRISKEDLSLIAHAKSQLDNLCDKYFGFNPLKPIKLSKEAFDKIEEIDNTPLTEKEKQSIKEFKEKVNKFYGTMEDKEWIHEKCGTNIPPTTVPEHPSKGNKRDKLEKELEEVQARCRELEAENNKLRDELTSVKYIRNTKPWQLAEYSDDLIYPHYTLKRKNKYSDIIDYIQLYVQLFYNLRKEGHSYINDIKPLIDAIEEWMEADA